MKNILATVGFSVIILTSYGQGKFTDARDGTVYATVTIEGVTWMAQNLKYNVKAGALFFDNDPNNGPGYGVLYDWKTATSVCPKDWHLPTGAEFHKLINHFEQKDSWGKVPSDPSSFGIQLGGMEDYEGIFSEMDESGYYWTSTEYDKDSAEYFSYLIINGMRVIDVSRKEDIADIPGNEKSNKYSVRCVKN